MSQQRLALLAALRAELEREPAPASIAQRLAAVGAAVVPALAEYAVVDVLDHGAVSRAAILHADASRTELLRDAAHRHLHPAEGLVARALASSGPIACAAAGGAEHVADFDFLSRDRVYSIVAVAAREGRRALGVLTLIKSARAGRFDADDGGFLSEAVAWARMGHRSRTTSDVQGDASLAAGIELLASDVDQPLAAAIDRLRAAHARTASEPLLDDVEHAVQRARVQLHAAVTTLRAQVGMPWTPHMTTLAAVCGDAQRRFEWLFGPGAVRASRALDERAIELDAARVTNAVFSALRALADDGRAAGPIKLRARVDDEIAIELEGARVDADLADSVHVAIADALARSVGGRVEVSSSSHGAIRVRLSFPRTAPATAPRSPSSVVARKLESTG